MILMVKSGGSEYRDREKKRDWSAERWSTTIKRDM